MQRPVAGQMVTVGCFQAGSLKKQSQRLLAEAAYF